MAKRERLFDDKDVTVSVNERVLEYLEDLTRTGLYGNTYAEALKIVFAIGLKNLIDAGSLKAKDAALPRDQDG